MAVRVLKIDGKVYLQMSHRNIDGMREIIWSEDISKEEAMLLVHELEKKFGIICERKGE